MTARLLLVAALMAFGCDEPEVTEAPGPPPGSETETETEPELPAPDPDEACARVIVVAWQGALAAGDDITRSEADARARADALRARIEGGATFADVARAESDASATGPRGGLMGTYTREDWPPVHAPIQDAIFALRDGELSEPIRAPYGWVIAERCEILGAEIKRFCASRSTAADKSSGTTIQPRRQPVIQKYFENPLKTIAASPCASALLGRSP